MKNLLMTGYNTSRIEDNTKIFIILLRQEQELPANLFRFSSFIKTAQVVKEFVFYFYMLMLKITIHLQIFTHSLEYLEEESNRPLLA